MFDPGNICAVRAPMHRRCRNRTQTKACRRQAASEKPQAALGPTELGGRPGATPMVMTVVPAGLRHFRLHIDFSKERETGCLGHKNCLPRGVYRSVQQNWRDSSVEISGRLLGLGLRPTLSGVSLLHGPAPLHVPQSAINHVTYLQTQV